MRLFMQIFTLFSFCFFFATNAFALGGSASCYYELYTPDHFKSPVITPTFQLDLSKSQFTSTQNPAIQRIIRLKTQPATVDGKTMTHFSFSQTYDGAHSGAVIPATNGTHVMMISKDGSDLVAAYLFCDVQVSNTNFENENTSSVFAKDPKFSTIRCINVRENHKYRELLFTHEKERRYNLEILKKDSSGQISRESLGTSDLYVFPDQLIKLAGLSAVVEFQTPERNGRARQARVHMNSPYYESTSWLCKATPK